MPGDLTTATVTTKTTKQLTLNKATGETKAIRTELLLAAEEKNGDLALTERLLLDKLQSLDSKT